MKFAFAGYDVLIEIAETLVENGWQLTDVFVEEADAVTTSTVRLKNLASRCNATLHYSTFDESKRDALAARSVALVICAGYGKRVASDQLHGVRVINVHPSLLPQGRGPWPLPYLLMGRERDAGVTYHLVSEEIDAGAILLQEKVTVSSDDNLETLTFKMKLAAIKLAKALAQRFDHILANACEQGKSGSYWPLPNNRQRTINWTDSVHEIDVMVKAFGKFYTFAYVDGIEYKVESASVWKEHHGCIVGSIVLSTHRELLVAAKDGYVLLRHYSAIV